MSYTARQLWIGIEEMLSAEQRDALGLREKNQSPHVWIVRLCDAINDCAKEHPPEPWAAELRAKNAALRRELDLALVELVRLKRVALR